MTATGVRHPRGAAAIIGLAPMLLPAMLLPTVLLATMLLAACGTPAQPAGDKMEQAVLFSGLAGQVVQGGRPVAGARLIRRWDYPRDKVAGEDAATADSEGRFTLPPVLHPHRKRWLLAQQFVVGQLIRVQANGQEWEVWVASKLDRKAGTERIKGPSAGTSPDQALRVVIDLDAPLALRGAVAGRTFFVDTPGAGAQ